MRTAIPRFGIIATVIAIAWLAWSNGDLRRRLDAAHQAALEEDFGYSDSVSAPDSVTAERVRFLRQAGEAGDVRTQYSHSGETIAVSPEDASHLARILTSVHSYDWPDDYVKGCLPEYAVSLRFLKGDRASEVWLCFGCNDALFVTQDKITGFGDFTPARNELLPVVKRLFPNDEQIQQLKPE